MCVQLAACMLHCSRAKLHVAAATLVAKNRISYEGASYFLDVAFEVM